MITSDNHNCSDIHSEFISPALAQRQIKTAQEKLDRFLKWREVEESSKFEDSKGDIRFAGASGEGCASFRQAEFDGRLDHQGEMYS